MRGDPFEKADFESSYCDEWRVRHAFLMLPAAAYVGEFLATFQDFPPRETSQLFDRSGLTIAATKPRQLTLA
jgi:hypothetical protein